MVRHRALLGLGGNLGDPVASMRQALLSIDAREDTDVVAVSRLYRTPPWGVTDQPFFFNACAAVETELSAHDLLDLCLQTERSLKRERRERWGPRTIDLDVLDHAGAIIADERLVLPHPRIAERAFVLVPLADIAPGLLIDGVAIEKRLAGLDRAGIEPASETGDWWKGPGAISPG